MQHYYTKNPQVGHARDVVETTIRNMTMQFVTDAGVFSKNSIDFGTRVLLQAIEVPSGVHILDVGCGYGPIGITLSKLQPDSHVTMIDINERAVELTKENCQRNGASRIKVLQSDLFENVKQERFDLIVTNPPIRAGKDVVHRIFSEGYELLNKGGTMWVVIQKKQGAPSAMTKLEQLFGDVREVTKDKGYRIFCATK